MKFLIKYERFERLDGARLGAWMWAEDRQDMLHWMGSLATQFTFESIFKLKRNKRYEVTVSRKRLLRWRNLVCAVSAMLIVPDYQDDKNIVLKVIEDEKDQSNVGSLLYFCEDGVRIVLGWKKGDRPEKIYVAVKETKRVRF